MKKQSHPRISTSCTLYLLAITAMQITPSVCESSDQSTDQPEARRFTALYPRTETNDKGSVTLFGPQIEAWEDFETMTAWMAFQIEVNGSGRNPYGSVRFTAQTEVDLSEREVLLHDAKIVELYIPGIQPYELEYSVFSDALLSASKRVPLDLVLEHLPQTMPLRSTAGLSEEPPPIFVANRPALLLTVDTEPVFLPVGESSLEFALNANWDLFRESGHSALYLLSDAGWLTADAFAGPWTWATALPSSMSGLPESPNWSRAKAAVPTDVGNLNVPDAAPPKVFYTTVPSELLVFQGEPVWESIADTGLEFASNTAGNCFRFDSELFYLSSGRWFRAARFDGPWILSGELPPAFQLIPKDHERGFVRASVPGTREAWEAALQASIPQKATFERTTATDLAPAIAYSGEPVFQTIEGTAIEMAINTSYQVFRYDSEFYLCHNAAWFRSTQASGPWKLADQIPSEFTRIPPSSPAHNTTYVTVAESSEEAITYQTTSGYQNSYVSDQGTVVNGTGFVQSAVAIWVVYEIGNSNNWHHYPYYPYYPWPPSYGYGAWYNPNSGRYGQSWVGYGPYGGARSTSVYNPTTGVYARGDAIWDSDEWAGRRYAYNPNTDTASYRRGYYDFDDNEGWSERVVRRGNEWLAADTIWEDGRMRSELETSRGGEGAFERERNGDLSSGTGSFETGNGRELESAFTRERDGDTINTERTITGENRSAELVGSVEDGSGQFSLQGSEGGNGSFNRELEDGELTGSGSFSKNGKTIESDTTRDAEGVKREFESSEGGQLVTGRQGDERSFVGESGSGDVYAGHDGNVYQKTESGWEQIEPSGNANRTQSLETVSAQRSSASSPNLGYPDATSQDRAVVQQLDRDRESRDRGFNRYDGFQRSRAMPTSRGGGARLRR